MSRRLLEGTNGYVIVTEVAGAAVHAVPVVVPVAFAANAELLLGGETGDLERAVLGDVVDAIAARCPVRRYRPADDRRTGVVVFLALDHRLDALLAVVVLVGAGVTLEASHR